MILHTYLTFNGNCRQAMIFYQQSLGGELTFQTIGESPLSEKMPPKMKDCLLHATLSKGHFRLMGSDMVGSRGLVKGNQVSLSLTCESETEIHHCFEKLSEGGTINHALEESFWGALFGDLTDRYGNHWLLNYPRHYT